MIGGIMGSLLIYLLLPDVGLTKIETVLVLIVGWMISTATIWWAQERENAGTEAERGFPGSDREDNTLIH